MYLTKSLSLAFIAVFVSCSRVDVKKCEQEILDADRAFSEYSLAHGQVAAFLEYAALDVVLIKPNRYPIVGHEKLQEYYKSKSDSSFVLTWEPMFARVAKSGELGYTYGYWQFYFISNPVKIEKGTYATVWQRQPNGQ